MEKQSTTHSFPIAPSSVPDAQGRRPAPRLPALTTIGILFLTALCAVGAALFQDAFDLTSLLWFFGLLILALLMILVPVRHQLPALLFAPFRVLVNFYAADTTFASQGSPQRRIMLASYGLSLAMIVGLLLTIYVMTISKLVGVVLLLAGLGFVYFVAYPTLDPLILFRRYVAYLRAAPAAESVALPAVRWWLGAVEWAVILAVTLLVTQPFQTSDPTTQLSGNESEWLTSSAYTAAFNLRQYGRIPLWQPDLESGEPFVENPFAFIFNPVTGMPALIWGAAIGLRVSVILSILLVGLGGWFLGYVLGMKTLGRLLLALLLMGKGNMHAMLSSGYFQLAVSQVYMPWVIGGTLAIIRLPRQRWPIVLTAVFTTLLFFTGNLWYVLPTVVGAVCVALPMIVNVRRRSVNTFALKRLVWAALLAGGLSAVALLPIAIHFDRIGKHPPEFEAGWVVPLEDVIPLYFDGSNQREINIFFPATRLHWQRPVLDEDEFYYSFVTPAWFVLLLLLVPLYCPAGHWGRRFWFVALGLAVLATIWGAGGNPLFVQMYRTIPGLGQWRFVGRALAIATFWIAVLVALRADSLWNIIFRTDWLKLGVNRTLTRVTPPLLGAGLLVAGGVAGLQVNDQWDKLDNIVRPLVQQTHNCISWLRQTHPDAPLAVWQLDYRYITTYLINHIRTWDVQADFEMLPLPTTVGQPDLNLNVLYPEYGYINVMEERFIMLNSGFEPVDDSPLIESIVPCLYRNPHAIPYAYTVSRSDLMRLQMSEIVDKLQVSPHLFTPVTLLQRQPDAITLRVEGLRQGSQVLGVQERAYPGWRVTINGKPARMESVGGQIGVSLPLGDDPLIIQFEYRPPLVMIGGLITIATSAFCAGYLLYGGRKRQI
ncbi:MAG: hypothetical protein R3E39_08360 [Anaerolineae bacterium]